MMNFARSCLLTMEVLHDGGSISDRHLPYYYLAHAFLELCPKIIIASRLEIKGNTINDIRDQLKKLDHDLEAIYSCALIEDFSKNIGIENVKIIETADGVWRYEFCIRGEKEKIIVYDSESLKYALVSKKINLGFVAYQFDHILELCNQVWNITTMSLKKN